MPAGSVRVLVTRPAAQGAEWVDGLQHAGIAADALPLIRIAAATDSAAVAQAWQRLAATSTVISTGSETAAARPALVMFVSANAVQHFMAQSPAPGSWPADVLAAAPGPGTAAALLQAGVPPGMLVQPEGDDTHFDSEALWQRLSVQPWDGRQVLVVRGETGRNWFAEQMRAQGAKVDFVAAYRRLPPQLDAAQRGCLAAAQGAPHAVCWHFSSSESVANLQGLCGPHDWSTSRALATHPRIADATRHAGFGAVEVIAPTLRALIERIGSGALATSTRSIESAAP